MVYKEYFKRRISNDTLSNEECINIYKILKDLLQDNKTKSIGIEIKLLIIAMNEIKEINNFTIIKLLSLDIFNDRGFEYIYSRLLYA